MITITYVRKLFISKNFPTNYRELPIDEIHVDTNNDHSREIGEILITRKVGSMKFNKWYRPFLAVAAMAVAGAGYAKADTVTDTTLNVNYTLTSSFLPETGSTNTFDVTLVIDATGFTGAGGATSGFLQAIAPQFSGATLVTLDSAPGGVMNWSGVGIPGGTNSSGCDSKGAPSGHVCFANFSVNSAGAVPDTLTFVFDVTLPDGQALGTSSDIKAVYNEDSFGGGKFLGQTSMGITIQPGGSTSVPEPGVLPLLGVGLIGLAFASRRLLSA
jgi:hypothetical protein